MHTRVVKQNSAQRFVLQLAQVGQAACEAGMRKNTTCEDNGIFAYQQGHLSYEGQLPWGNTQ